MKCNMVLTLLVLGNAVVSGIGWCPETVMAATVTDSSFNWQNVGGYDVTARSGGDTGTTCMFFSGTNIIGDLYKITRGDPTETWVAGDPGSGIEAPAPADYLARA